MGMRQDLETALALDDATRSQALPAHDHLPNLIENLVTLVTSKNEELERLDLVTMIHVIHESG